MGRRKPPGPLRGDTRLDELAPGDVVRVAADAALDQVTELVAVDDATIEVRFATGTAIRDRPGRRVRRYLPGR